MSQGPYRTRESVRTAVTGLDPRRRWRDEDIGSAHTVLVELRSSIARGDLDADLDGVLFDLEMLRVEFARKSARRRVAFAQAIGVLVAVLATAATLYAKAALGPGIFAVAAVIYISSRWMDAEEADTIIPSLAETIALGRSRVTVRALPAPAPVSHAETRVAEKEPAER